jgi:Secretion system C-terminal sorting domain
MKHIYHTSIVHLFILCAIHLTGQNTKRVLFLGNSYTYSNNLPQILSDMATSSGKTLIFDSHTPGGYYLGQHLTNPISLAKIAIGNWDYVVLQEQSMALAYPGYYLNGITSSIQLDSIIKANNVCGQTMFYSTWGRKNGDSYLCGPPYCTVNTLITRTYYEMDSTIESHYKVFADSIKSSMTPVGAVWRHIRQNYPSIELFQPDDSHPSLEGSYAAACAFYATLFRSDPTFINFNAGLSITDAANIKAAAKLVVFDQLLNWNVGVYDSLLSNSCSALKVDDKNINNDYWRVFPNPVSDVLSVKFSDNKINDKIYLYTTLGILVKAIEVKPNTTIDFNALPSGLYFIKSMNTQQTLKVLKK